MRNSWLFLLLLVTTGALAETPTERKAAAAHYRQGRAFYDAQVYDKALAEFQAAYQIAPRPLLLYHLGRTHRALGDPRTAQKELEGYLAAQPDGEVADDARIQVAAVAKEIAAADASAAAEIFAAAEASRRAGAVPEALAGYQRYLEVAPSGKDSAQAREELRQLTLPSAETVAPAPPQPAPLVAPVEGPRAATKNRWVWISAGAASVGAGLALDLIPSSAKNGKFDALDVVPLVLYAAGATAIAVGIF